MAKEIKIPRPGAPKVGRHPKASDKAPEGNWMDRNVRSVEGTKPATNCSAPEGASTVSRALKTPQEPPVYSNEGYDFRKFADHPNVDAGEL